LTVDGAKLCLDIYRPAEPGTPVVLYVHGGGWTRATRVLTVANGGHPESIRRDTSES
jgi:carboxylesterase type B